jgi:hypothetical protein
MTRINATKADHLQFRGSDNTPTRAQKLEILRRDLIANYSRVGHGHAIADVEGLEEILALLLAGNASYRIPGYFREIPGADDTLHLHSVTDDIYFQADFEGSQADIGINPTATFVVTIYRNPTFTGTVITGGEVIGTLTYSAAGVVTWATTNNDVVQLNKGDVVGLKAPAADATAAVASFTLYAIMAYIANLLLYTGDQNEDGVSLIMLSGDQAGGAEMLSGDQKYG